MMVNVSEFKRLLYAHEVLWAKFDIRDHYLNMITQVVYENIGQVLSLVRMQLDFLSSQNPSPINGSSIDHQLDPSQLIGQVIQDLRMMCRSFNPEQEYLVKLGFLRTLENELKLLGTDKVRHVLEVKGTPEPLDRGTELIVFRMLQEMLHQIGKEYNEDPIKVEAAYKENSVTFIIEYAGKPLEWKRFHTRQDADLSFSRLNVYERAELIHARLHAREVRPVAARVELTIPIKSSIYE